MLEVPAQVITTIVAQVFRRITKNSPDTDEFQPLRRFYTIERKDRAGQWQIQKGNGMNIANKTVLITGANRGIGRGLVNEALRRRAKRVYAGTRSALTIGDERVTPLTLDVTSVEQIQRAVDEVDTLHVLINADTSSMTGCRMSELPCKVVAFPGV
jgi:hypothetical protein